MRHLRLEHKREQRSGLSVCRISAIHQFIPHEPGSFLATFLPSQLLTVTRPYRIVLPFQSSGVRYDGIPPCHLAAYRPHRSPQIADCSSFTLGRPRQVSNPVGPKPLPPPPKARTNTILPFIKLAISTGVRARRMRTSSRRTLRHRTLGHFYHICALGFIRVEKG